MTDETADILTEYEQIVAALVLDVDRLLEATDIHDYQTYQRACYGEPGDDA